MCVTLLCLVGGKETGWSWNQPSCFNQSEVHSLVLSLKLLLSSWVGTLVPVEELRIMYQIFMYIPWEGTRRNQDPDPSLHYWFFSAFSHPPLPIRNCLNLPFGTQGRSRRLKPFSYKEETETWKGFCTREGPTGSCLFSKVVLHL